jgi:hypothetical protein
MAIALEWIITRFEVINKDDLSNVVIRTHFDIKGVDGDLQAFIQSGASLGDTDPDGFTPLEQVTSEQAVAWTKTALGDKVRDLENRVIEQIERQRVARLSSQSLTPSWIPTTDTNQIT